MCGIAGVVNVSNTTENDVWQMINSIKRLGSFIRQTSIDELPQRCSVRSGITGLALDLRYTHESSLWLDMQIAWWTVGRLSGKGAN